MPLIRWTEDELRAYLARDVTRNTRAAVRPSDVELNSLFEPSRTDAPKAPSPRYRIEVHSRLRRPGDPDGRSIKFVLDGLVSGGLLRDDSADTIAEVRFTQEKADQDETIIRLIEVWTDKQS